MLPTGFALVPGDDPTGNGQDTLAVMFNDKRVGVYIVGHNSAGPIVVLGAADSDDVYQTQAGAQSVTVMPGALAVQALG